MHGFQFWLDGLSAEEADRRISHYSYLSSPDPALRSRDVEDQWRTYADLEYYLKKPNLLASQSLFQIEPEQQKELLTKYWEFDERLGRRMLGLKVSSDTIDVEETAKQLGLPRRACSRMLDILQHIMKQMEGDHNPLNERRSIQEFLENHFRLNTVLAHQYTQVLFSCYHRISLTTKQLQRLNFQVHDQTEHIQPYRINSRFLYF